MSIASLDKPDRELGNAPTARLPRSGNRRGVAHRWVPSSARSTPHLRLTARRSARPDIPVRSVPRYGGRRRTPRTPRLRRPRHIHRQKPCRPTVQCGRLGAVSPVGSPCPSSFRWRNGGVSMIHWSRGTSGNWRYGWKPKHSGTGRSRSASPRCAPSRSARTTVTVSASRCGNGKLANKS